MVSDAPNHGSELTALRIQHFPLISHSLYALFRLDISLSLSLSEFLKIRLVAEKMYVGNPIITYNFFHYLLVLLGVKIM